MKNILIALSLSLFLYGPANAAVFFTESFENSNFTSRGWFDSPKGTIDTVNPKIGGGAFRCDVAQNGGGCTNGAPARHQFGPSNSFYVSFWVRYSSNYRGTGTTSGPHEFYIITTADDIYEGLSYNMLDVYIENSFTPSGEGIPGIQIQDGKMIDETKIGQDLQNITEQRAVAGCNGNGNLGGVNTFGLFGGTNCYAADSITHWNQYKWLASNTYFKAAAGTGYKADWHFVEVYVQLNSISGGKGQKDGIVQYWLDGTQVININNAVLRTAANPTMQFREIVIGPYFGGNSPVSQTLWYDELTVGDTRPSVGSTPSPPQNLQVQ